MPGGKVSKLGIGAQLICIVCSSCKTAVANTVNATLTRLDVVIVLGFFARFYLGFMFIISF